VREGSSKCGGLGEEVSNFFSLTMCPPLNWRCGGLEGVGSGKAVARTFSAGSDNLDDICVCVTRARFEREKKKGQDERWERECTEERKKMSNDLRCIK
jgi:hypothetical protein